MKKLFNSVIAIFSLAITLLSQDFSRLPSWQEGYMDIHHIATGQGDCTFIIFPDGTTLLIDAGDVGFPNGTQSWYHIIPSNLKTPGEYICDYINYFKQNTRPLDYALLTHFHSDHIGSLKTAEPGSNGYDVSGLLLVGDYIGIRTLVDRDYPDYNFPSRDNIVRECDMIYNYFKFIDHHIKNGMTVQKFDVGSRTQFELKYNPKAYRRIFEVRNLCANGLVWTGTKKTKTAMFSGDSLLFDENLNSCGFVLKYGNFKYYNCGDLPGGNTFRYKCKERNFESFVADVCGKITVMKCDHHAAPDGVNEELLYKSQPKDFVITACHKEHPYRTTMERLADKSLYPNNRDYYITSESSRTQLGEDLWSFFKPAGHVVVRVYPEGKSYQMFVLDVFSKGYEILYQSDLHIL